MKLWPVEHFWLTFFPDQHWICADLERKWAKSVQLVRVSFFWSDCLQNPYFKCIHGFISNLIKKYFDGIKFITYFFLLQPATVLTIIGSYGLFLLCCMGWFAKKIPMRIYYDEANDKTFAIFMHLLIPFRFSKKSLPHHSFRITQKNSKGGYSISNGTLKLMLTPEKFRKPVDFTRLLSQWIKSFVEIVSGVNVAKPLKMLK